MARSRPSDPIEAGIAARMRPPREGTGEPFAGMDRSGLPPRADLGRTERRALLGIVPRRSLWKELAPLDEQIGEMQQRLSAAQSRTSALLSERVGAPERDTDTLARWQLSGAKGPRPEPTTAALDEQITAAQLDADALERATDVVLEERAAYVEKHRSRLASVAEQQTQAARDRMLPLIDELEATRASLVECRQATLWALCYPDAAASTETPTGQIAGGLAQPVVDTLGLRPAPQLIAARVLELLRRDAEVLATATTPEQAKLLGDDAAKPGGAYWHDSDEGRAWEVEQRQQALARHEQW